MDEDKPWLSIESQIRLLETRGVIIDDKDKAYEFLLENNYFRLSGFTLCHRKDDVFQKSIKFSDLIDICRFDCELRTLIMGLLGHVEVTFKSLIAYYHTEEYGSMGYESSANFNNIEIYSTLISKVIKIKKYYADNPEVYVKHYVEDKHGKLPFWAVMELMNFTDTSKIFRALPEGIKLKIIQQYLGFTFGSAVDYVENWLWCASVLRNIAAHRGRLYNRLLQVKPKLSRENKDLLLHTKKGEPIFNKLFSYLLAIRCLYPKKDLWDDFCYDISELTYRFPFVNLREYGFPDDWRKKLQFT